MSATKRKRGAVEACAGCEHRWGRHSGGIGSCSEPGCECSSYLTAEHARWKHLRESSRGACEAFAKAARKKPMTDEEWQAFLARVDRILGTGWRRRTERPSTKVEGIAPADALREFGLGPDATSQDVVREFRRRALKAHPDVGGTAEAFKTLIRTRDAALAALEEAAL